MSEREYQFLFCPDGYDAGDILQAAVISASQIPESDGGRSERVVGTGSIMRPIQGRRRRNAITRPVQGKPYRRASEDRLERRRGREVGGVSIRLSRMDLEQRKCLRIEQGRPYARERKRRGRERSSGSNGEVEESLKIADAKREYRKGNRFLDVGCGL